MGIKNLEKMTPTHETPNEILELVRMSVLENLQSDFYHSEDEHAKSAIELHKKVASKYPNFYVDVFTDIAFTNYFLDAHKILSLPFILQDEKNIDAVLKNILEVSPTRIDDIYRICMMKETFGVSVPKSILRKIFEIQTKHIENEKGENYVALMGTKYASNIHDIMASVRSKKQKLSPHWQEAMKWVFERDENYPYTLPAFKEVSKLRKAVKNGSDSLIQPKYVPFSVWQGYAYALGYSKKDIFKEYKLMTKNEVKRYLATLQKYGLLESSYHKKKIEDKVMKVRVDLLELMYALKVLDNKAKEILMKKGKQEFESTVNNLKETLKTKKISVAVDSSGGCAGHTHLLDPEIQKKIINNEPVPKWAKIIQRESFNANILIAKVLSDASNHSIVYLFNESAQETPMPTTFEDLIEELKNIQPSGGSNILEAVKKAISTNPDIAFIITDLNENVPFQGALKLQLEKLAKEFAGQIVFILTETIVERPEAVQLDEIIKSKALSNVFIVPAKKLKQLENGFILIKLLEKTKKLFAESKKKKKVKKEAVDV